MRILYYIPITHTFKESVASRGQSLMFAKAAYGEKKALSDERKVYQDWLQIVHRIKEEIKKQNLDYSKLFIYQDSWLDDFEIDPIEMQETRVPNQIILGKLIEKGAKLVPVEDKKLFNKHKEIAIEEEILNLAFERVQEKEDLEFQAKILKRLTVKQKELKNETFVLMRKRDEYIAKRIHQTLPEDSIAILFMGANHKVTEKLDPAKIKIVNLLEEGGQK